MDYEHLASKLAAIDANPFIPWTPTPTQLVFLCDDRKEGLYGGAAGGGKSIALLMAAAEYVDIPNYSAIIFRRTLTMLNEPGALIPISQEWFRSQAHWSEQKNRWTFPSGATITFRYLDGPNDHLNYQGAAYHFVGFDEATQFRFSQYQYMFSRVRKSEADPIPIRIRGATNPGGISHGHFKERFFDETHPDRFFVAAKLEDNEHLDLDDYDKSLRELDPVLYEQLREGSWADPQSKIFRQEWLKRVPSHELPNADFRIVVGDTAQKDGEDNDYSVFYEWGFNTTRRLAWPISRIKGKWLYPDLVNEFKAYMASIRKGPVIRAVHIEDKSSGISLNQDLQRNSGLPVIPIKRGKANKEERAKDILGHVISGNVLFPNNKDFSKPLNDELTVFPSGKHDDEVDVTVDAISILFNEPEHKPRRKIGVSRSGAF